ncbi:MAG: hypothetical protein IPJ13_01290 [Saprospiraceae bacterium]|nr:hypothetical protein [Saprospiraceae bacterium]
MHAYPGEDTHITKLEQSTHMEVLACTQEDQAWTHFRKMVLKFWDTVRRLISKGKCGGQSGWTSREQRTNLISPHRAMTCLVTSKPTWREWHFIALRQVQSENQKDVRISGVHSERLLYGRRYHPPKDQKSPHQCTGDEYIRMIAMSRIEISQYHQYQDLGPLWAKKAQICSAKVMLDFGNMIEENVVPAAVLPLGLLPMVSKKPSRRQGTNHN